MSVTLRLVLMATTAAATVLISGVRPALAQKRIHRQAQYEFSPPVELPSVTSEGSTFPSMDDAIPPSLRPQTLPTPDGVSASDAPFSGVEYPGGSLLQGDTGPMLGMQPAVDELTGEPLEPTSYFGAEGPAPIYSTGSWWWRGNWYTMADVVVLDRSEVRPNLVIFDPATNTPYSNNDLANLNFRPGTRITLGRILGRDPSSRDHMTEFSFLGGFHWDAGRTITSSAPGNTIDTFLVNAAAANPLEQIFFDAASQTFTYASKYNDFQLNYKLQTRPGKDAMALQPNGMWVQHATSGQVRSVLFGMRLSTVDEGTSYTSNRTVNAVDQSAVYNVVTNNDMFGFHTGGDLIDVHDDWSWGIRGRVGTLLNFVDRRSSLESAGLAPSNQKLTDERLSWVLETGMFGKYQVRPNLAFRAAYDFIYYNNVCLAAENLGFVNGFPELISDGPVYFHGSSFGFDWTW